MVEENIMHVYMHIFPSQWNIIQPSKAILTFVTTWENVNFIILSQISQRKMNTVQCCFCVESEKANPETAGWWLPEAEEWGK